MNPRFLETFILVARLRSFSLAAKQLHTTQANVSARITTLEKELGVPLLVRGYRDVSLTPQGLIALEGAQSIVQTLADFHRKVCGHDQMKGRMVLGTSYSITTLIAPLFVEYLHINYPQVTLEVHEDTSTNLSKELIAGNINLAFLLGPVPGRDIVNLNLISLACSWVASPDLDLPDRPVGADELASSHTVISFSSDSVPYAVMRDYLRSVAFQNISIIACNSIAAIVSLVKRGMGIAVLPDVVVEDDIAAGKLRKIATHQPFPPLAFHAVYRESEGNELAATLAKMACKVAADYCATRESSDTSW